MFYTWLILRILVSIIFAELFKKPFLVHYLALKLKKIGSYVQLVAIILREGLKNNYLRKILTAILVATFCLDDIVMRFHLKHPIALFQSHPFFAAVTPQGER